MKGHIKQRSAGHFAIVLDTRDPQTGKRRRKWISFSGTLRGARIECARLVTEMKSGAYVDATRETIAAFLDRWIEHMQGQVSPRSLERYAELCRNNIAPLLGAIPLTKLQPANISQAYAKALASGRRDGTGGLSPLTVHHMHRVLREALQQAVRWQLLARNPVDAVRPPKVERKQMQTLDAEATVVLIEAARGTNLFMPILLGVLCGLRRGEITALRWRSIDLDRGQLSVTASTEQTNRGIREKETKSGKSRTVALPSLIVDELRRHRVAQAEGLLAAGVRLTDDHHVVAREDGQPLQPRSLTHAFVKFVRGHGLAPIRLHDLRHSHATHMLASGVHPKIAQERLGHSSVSVTIDLYSHVLPGMQAEAVSRVDAVLRDALNRRAVPTKKW
ncbi:MAG TPA: tyrosine-type recombinase/integrase [Bradyrhizobium sp.]|jgi:integrase|nr:tyrosine-type recombinase/integrase [Bradyrhizobium sp.]